MRLTASSNLFNTPSIFDIYPVDEPPGSTSKPNSSIIIVQDDERTIRTFNFSILSTLIPQAPGFFPSAGIKSVCRHPQKSHNIVI